MTAGLTIAIVRYLLILPLSWTATLLAYLFAPLAALPVFVHVGSDSREYYVWLWRWLTTHDAPADTFFIDGYFIDSWILGRFTREQIRASPFLRYVGRVLWIWRNPAYQVKHWLGYDTSGSEPIHRIKEADGVGRMFIRKNHKGHTGFYYEKRTNRWHIQFGWKLYRRDPDGKRMIAFRLKPSL